MSADKFRLSLTVNEKLNPKKILKLFCIISKKPLVSNSFFLLFVKPVKRKFCKMRGLVKVETIFLFSATAFHIIFLFRQSEKAVAAIVNP